MDEERRVADGSTEPTMKGRDLWNVCPNGEEALVVLVRGEGGRQKDGEVGCVMGEW